MLSPSLTRSIPRTLLVTQGEQLLPPSGGGFEGFGDHALAVAEEDCPVDLVFEKTKPPSVSPFDSQTSMMLRTVAELSYGPFELAGEALAVEAEVGQSFRVVFGHDDHGGELQDCINGGDAVESPGGVGEGLDELGFGGALGLVFVGEGF
jgi:hypothetical protein